MQKTNIQGESTGSFGHETSVSLYCRASSRICSSRFMRSVCIWTSAFIHSKSIFGPLHLFIANTGQSQSVTHVACERVQAEGSWSRYSHARRYDYYPPAAPSSWWRPKPSPTWMSTGCASWPVYPRLLRGVGASASWNFGPRLLQSELWNLQHETYLHCDSAVGGG